MASGDDRVGEAPRTAAGGEAPDVIPSICYGDVAAAIDWLERAFGFERHQVYDGDGGAVLRFGSGWVGLSAEREPGSDRFKHFPVQSPRQAGTLMGGFYVIVDDPDALHERAR